MMKGGMQVVTFQRQRERQAEELLLTPGEMAARCDWQQVRRMREEMPDNMCQHTMLGIRIAMRLTGNCGRSTR